MKEMLGIIDCLMGCWIGTFMVNKSFDKWGATGAFILAVLLIISGTVLIINTH